MPELPEVETVKRTLTPIVGATVQKVWTSGKPLHMATATPWDAVLQTTRRKTIKAIHRKGKYILLEFVSTKDLLLIHLGMSGRLRIFAKQEVAPKHSHLILTLQGDSMKAARGSQLIFSDPRRFGQVGVVYGGDFTKYPSLAKLGPDPLIDSITSEYLYKKAGRRSGNCKSFLMDQKVICGVGNIYASEALWQAKISPTTAPNTLSKKDCGRLVAAVSKVLQRALTNGGTSLRDFVAADGKEGNNAEYLFVYGRENKNCLRRSCKGKIQKMVTQGRATYYCNLCQQV